MRKTSPEFYVSQIEPSPERVSRYKTAAPWKKEDVGFTILNQYYPLLHTHEYYEIYVTLSGSAIHTINGLSYVVRPGDCCLVRPNDCHCLEKAPNDDNNLPYLNVNFVIKPSFFEQISSPYGVPPLPTTDQSHSPLAFSISTSTINRIRSNCLLIQSPFISPPPENIAICKAMVCELFSRCVEAYHIKPVSNRPTWLSEFALSLQDPNNFSSKITTLIENIPYSYSYVQKQFRRYYGMPIVTFFNAAKVIYAKELLTGTAESAIRISQILGYDSVAHFNHLFKQIVGTTPMKFRKAAVTGNSFTEDAAYFSTDN